MKKTSLFLIAAVAATMSFTSCNYDEIVDFDYPSSKIFLPIAVNGSISTDGIYTIADGASTLWVSPTTGQPLKYSVSRSDNAFIIPLGIFRSGFEEQIAQSATVNLVKDDAKTQSLISEGMLSADLIPAGKVTMPQSVTLAKGENETQFDVVIDLAYLASVYPQKVAFTLCIEGNDAINEELNTGTILIDTRVMKPVADFSCSLAGSDSRCFTFQNNSLYWDFFSGDQPFTWDFKDGSAVSHEINPQHSFPSAGVFEVELTAKGVMGDEAHFTLPVTVAE